MLAVEDPKDATNDLCKGSYQIVKIRAAFEYAYQQLGAPAARSESILQRIIRCRSGVVCRWWTVPGVLSVHREPEVSSPCVTAACFGPVVTGWGRTTHGHDI